MTKRQVSLTTAVKADKVTGVTALAVANSERVRSVIVNSSKHWLLAAVNADKETGPLTESVRTYVCSPVLLKVHLKLYKIIGAEEFTTVWMCNKLKIYKLIGAENSQLFECATNCGMKCAHSHSH